MLSDLLHREWLLHRRVALILFSMFGAYQVYTLLSVDSSRAWAVFATIYAAILGTTLFVREDRFQAAAWTCSLPVTRREIVRARFVAAWLMVAASLAGATLLAAVIPWTQVRVGGVVEPWTLLILGTVTTAILALLLPFTIRFGMMGMMIFLVVGQLAGAGLLLWGTLLHRGGAGSRVSIRETLAAIGEAVLRLREAMTPVGFYVAVLAALLLLNWSSYRLSAWLFSRREL